MNYANYKQAPRSTSVKKSLSQLPKLTDYTSIFKTGIIKKSDIIKPSGSLNLQISPRFQIGEKKPVQKNVVVTPKLYERKNFQIGKQNIKADGTSKINLDETSHNNRVDSSISLSVRTRRKAIRSSQTQSQTMTMLVSLKAKDMKVQSKVPIDLVCVVDNSSSMNGKKINLVKNAINCLLHFLKNEDRISVITFNSKASCLIPFINTTGENKEKIMKDVTAISTNTGTNIDLGLREAFQVMKWRDQSNPVTSVFLLSDGLDPGAQQRVQQSLEEYNVKEDVTIHTFGFGRGHDAKLMSGIADLRDGNFYFIGKLKTIDEAFVDCLGGLMSVVAKDIKLEISPEQSEILQGVEIIKAYGEGNMWTQIGEGNHKKYVTKMAALLSGTQKDFVLELKIPPTCRWLNNHEKRIKIASVKAEMNLINGNLQEVKNAELFINLLNQNEKFQEDDDREVMVNFFRIKSASLIAQARMLAEQGNHKNGLKILQDFLKELMASSLKEDELVKNIALDVQITINNLSPEIFMKNGQFLMQSISRSQMKQKSNIAGSLRFQNSIQNELANTLKDYKLKMYKISAGF